MMQVKLFWFLEPCDNTLGFSTHCISCFCVPVYNFVVSNELPNATQ